MKDETNPVAIKPPVTRKPVETVWKGIKQPQQIDNPKKQIEKLKESWDFKLKESLSQTEKKTETKDKNVGWDSSEHIGIGNKTFAKFVYQVFESLYSEALYDNAKDAFKILNDQNLYDERHCKITLINSSGKTTKIKLGAGQIIALAGDFYGLPSEPISNPGSLEDRKKRFIKAFDTLANADIKEVEAILRVIDDENNKIVKAVKENKKPTIELANGSMTRNIEYMSSFNSSLFSGCFFSSMLSSKNKYLTLTFNNYDHFGKGAIDAYEAGHEVALDTAESAAKASDKYVKVRLLLRAITQELFADHFLTDLFSSGHIRTPRRELTECMKEKSVPKFVGDLLSKTMHDEDNIKGVNVKNSKGNCWKAYGDGYYFNPENKENAEQCCSAVLHGLLDVYNVFCGGKNLNGAFDYIPVPVDEEQNENSKKDADHPLFKIDCKSKKLVVRNELGNSKCSTYSKEDWSPIDYFNRQVTGFFSKESNQKLTESEEERKQAEEELKFLEGGDIKCRLQ